MSPPAGRADDAWPDPALRAATRTRRRRLRRRIYKLVLFVGAVVLGTRLGLLSARGWALVLGACLAAWFLRLLVSAEEAEPPGPFTRTMATANHPPPPSGRREELERTLDLATISAGDAHHMLRPLVIDIAGTWLHVTHGFELTDPEAPTLLPPALWALASPTARRPDHPHGPGPTPAELDDLVSSLEALR